ncbi:hypothetical protein, conserved [Trypanosoma cruzi]|uniref:Uncharacterized protein n=1 Tax=Trypanosoma cruzi (strain CL Brener) TaxID=353153 RepID=Q4E4C1_TRYCC|nr:hypothetical protein, conserved [Trypanosoma cruzi]EAN99641.1 hypothetical protein, conserved [Trypanosoma cruzi]|eukprot:XP_821492.1 hypothetical protein [Trypanosoma cruzi strain CL Brener]
MTTERPCGERNGHTHSSSAADGTFDQPDTAVLLYGGLPPMPKPSVQRGEGSMEREFDQAAVSPSPVAAVAASSVVGGDTSPGSSPHIGVHEADDPTKNFDNSTEEEHMDLFISAMSPQNCVDRPQRRARGALMPPLPSPGEADAGAMMQSEMHTTPMTKTHTPDLRVTMYENQELRRELATVRASLRQALQTIETRELECVELHRLVDEMQAQLNGLKPEANLRPTQTDAQGNGEGSTRPEKSAFKLQATKDTTGPQIIGKYESKEEWRMTPSRELFAAEVKHDAHTEASTTTAIAAVKMNATDAPTTVEETISMGQLCEERDRLAKELAQTKIVVAEQETVLDRLGLRFPYPGALVAAARRTIPAFEPLRKSRKQKPGPLVVDRTTQMRGERAERRE